MNQLATFAAGCFWGVEAKFRHVDGVLNTQCGYIGGIKPNPTYQAVCSRNTGHAEAVQVTFDDNRITFNDLLNIFWEIHNPTQLNQQGPDVGNQYRSAIFYHDEQQHSIAKHSKQVLGASGKYAQPIVTEIVPATAFYPAEEYHQNYFEKQK